MPSHCFDTALGPCAIVWEAEHVTGFRLLPSRPATDSAPPPAWVQAIAARVRRHLAGESVEDFADLPYAWETVTDYQRRLYTAALDVKSGRTVSYGDLARSIGQGPGGARAVGTALGQNPWPVLVPCHRFLAADGRMTGFSAPGGIRTKLRLLAIEGNQWFAE